MMREERFHFAPKRGVVGAGLREEFVALPRVRSLERIADERLYLLPTRGIHLRLIMPQMAHASPADVRLLGSGRAGHLPLEPHLRDRPIPLHGRG
jgi:hypothetical protein